MTMTEWVRDWLEWVQDWIEDLTPVWLTVGMWFAVAIAYDVFSVR